MPRHQCLIYEDSPTKHLISLSSLIRQNLEESCRHPGDSGAFLGCFPSRQGRFDADRMIRMLADTVEHTPANGHTGLFATGDMNWESGEQGDFGNPLEYERALEELFRWTPELRDVCQYRIDTLPGEMLSEMGSSRTRACTSTKPSPA
ncbi:MAG TPA: MEDS domain-containing protein [Bryobacteraceae bacterium]|nr:MEDS domain-containing protein [Bryobacteraceae bacterium]